MKNFYTIDGECVSTITVEKSKFICRIKSIDSELSAKEYVADIVKRETGATHNCYAYVLQGETRFKFSDDGEPHGTAGQPMLEVLKAKKLENVIAVVTRYFGGIKLGTGGLARAYSGAVIDCLQKANITCKYYSTVYNVCFDYNSYSKISKNFSSNGVKIISTNYNDGVDVVFAVQEERVNDFTNNLSLSLGCKVELKEIYKDYITFSV